VDDTGAPIGRISRFEGGAIVWHKSDGSTAVFRSDGTLVVGQSNGWAAKAALTLSPPTKTTATIGKLSEAVGCLIEAVAKQQAQIAHLASKIDEDAILLGMESAAKAHYTNILETLNTLKDSPPFEVDAATIEYIGNSHTEAANASDAVRASEEQEATQSTHEVEAKLGAAYGLVSTELSARTNSSHVSETLRKEFQQVRQASAHKDQKHRTFRATTPAIRVGTPKQLKANRTEA
jgi:hypothetical protein